jgi:hypothetical protein
MLRVTVELVPGGDETRVRTIARMTIANISALADISDYEFKATETANPLAGTPAREVHGFVRGHDRRQGVWSLVAKASSLAAEG